MSEMVGQSSVVALALPSHNNSKNTAHPWDHRLIANGKEPGRVHGEDGTNLMSLVGSHDVPSTLSRSNRARPRLPNRTEANP
jgi:hypothetical protein